MPDLTVVIGADSASIRAAMEQLKADVKSKSAEMSKDFAGAFKNADTDATAALRKINAEYDKVKNASASTVADVLRAQQRWSADTAKLSTDVRAAHASMTSATSGTAGAMGILEKAARPVDALLGQMSGGGVQVGRVFAALTSPFALVSEALLAIVVSAKLVLDAFANQGKELRSLAAVAGASATAVHGIQTAFTLAGVESGKFQLALFRVSQIVDEGGTKLQKFGVSAHTVSGDMREPLDVFLDVRDRISDMGDAAQRNAALMQLFGRAGRELAPIFAQSREEFARFVTLAEAKSHWSEDQQKASIAYVQKLAALQVQWESLRNSLAIPIIGAISIVFKGFEAREGEVPASRLTRDFFSTLLGISSVKIPLEPEFSDAASRAAAESAVSWSRQVAAAVEKAKGEAILAEQAQWQATMLSETKIALDKNTEIDAESLKIRDDLNKRALQDAQQRATLETAIVQQRVAASVISEAQGTTQKIALAAQEYAATKLYWDKKLADASNAMVKDVATVTALESQRLAALAAASAKIAGLRATDIAQTAAQAQRKFQIEVDALKQTGQIQTALVKEQEAARVLTVEQGAIVTADVQIKALQDEKARTDAELARFGADTTRRLELEKQSAALGTQIQVAEAGRRTAVWAQFFVAYKGLIEQQAIVEQTAHAKTLATIKATTADAFLVAETAGGSTVAQATRVADAQIAAAGRTRDATLEDIRNAEARYAETAIADNVTNTARAVQAAKFRAERAAAELASETSIADVRRAVRKAEADLELAATRQTTTDQLAVLDAQAAAIDALLKKPVDSERTRQELLTQAYDVASQRRIVIAESQSNKILAIAANEIDRLAAIRQKDIDNEIKARTAAILGVQTATDRRVEIEAGVVTRVLVARQKLIDNLNVLSGAQEAFFQQGLEGWAAQSKAVGDVAGFFDATFLAALTKGTDTFTSIKTLAEGLASDLRSALGTFFTDFKANLDKGLGFWESFGNAMSSLWNNLMNSLLKRFADFLIDMAIRAAASQSGGGILGLVFGAAGVAGTVAAGSGGGASSDTPGSVIGSSGTPIATSGITNNNEIALTSSTLSLLKLASSIVGVWDAIQIGMQAFVTALRVGTTAGTAFSYGASAFATALKAAAPYLSTVAVVAGVVTVALTAMRTDINDVSKAWLTSMYAVAAGLVAFGGPIGIVVGIIIGIVAAIIDLSGILVEHSAEWLKFSRLLGATLEQESNQLGAFAKDLSKATNLTGIATSIEKFRHDIEDFAGVGGFFAATSGQGVFHVPGIPGATGTEHEGKVAFDFGPFVKQIQDAIDKIVESVRVTISQKLPTAAYQALGGPMSELAIAFTVGVIAPLLKEFDDLVASTTATVADVKAFEDHLKAVGAMLTAIVTESAQLRDLTAVVKDVLPTNLTAGATAMIEGLRGELLALAGSATTTADDLTQLEAKIKTLTDLISTFERLSVEVAAMNGDWRTVTELAANATKVQLASAQRTVEAAQQAYDGSTKTGAALLTAGTALEKSILARYNLEMKLIADIEKAIADALNTTGNAIVTTFGEIANRALAAGDPSKMATLLGRLDDIGNASGSAALKLWSVTAALQAIAASVPSLVKGGGFSDPSSIQTTVVAAAMPFITRLYGMIVTAARAGDVTGELALLARGAELARGLAAAAIAGVQQWATQAIAAAQAVANAQTTANNARITALGVEKTALEATLQASRAWAGVVTSVGDYLTQLRLGPNAPPNPLGQFTLAQTGYQSALAAFTATPTVANATAVQTAASNFLAAAQLIYTKPSPEYAALFASVTAGLEAVKATAATFVTPEEEAVAQLKAIDDQITVLNAANARIAAELVTTTATINAAADREIESINARLSGVMQQIADEQERLLTLQVAAQLNTLQTITNGMDVQDFMALKARETAEALATIRDDLAAYLAGGALGDPGLAPQAPLVTGVDAIANNTANTVSILQQIRDGLGFVPHAQHGMDWTPSGLVRTHQGEMVLTPNAAVDYRAGGGGGSRSTVVNVTFQPGSIAGGNAGQVADEVVRRIKDGVRGIGPDSDLRYHIERIP